MLDDVKTSKTELILIIQQPICSSSELGKAFKLSFFPLLIL